jgi:hypothetical protein
MGIIALRQLEFTLNKGFRPYNRKALPLELMQLSRIFSSFSTFMTYRCPTTIVKKLNTKANFAINIVNLTYISVFHNNMQRRRKHTDTKPPCTFNEYFSFVKYKMQDIIFQIITKYLEQEIQALNYPC